MPRLDQMAGERHADLAEARDHDVVLELGGARVEVGERGPRLALRAGRAGAAADRRRERGRSPSSARSRPSSSWTAAAPISSRGLQREAEQHEGELAALGEQAAELEREARRVAERPGEAVEQRAP